MTQAELARAAGASRQTVQRLESVGDGLALEQLLDVLERDGVAVLVLLELLTSLLGIRGRVCTRCERWRQASMFRPNPKLRGGLDSWCRGCHVDETRGWREVKADEVNARRRTRYADRRDVGPRTCRECGETYTSRRADAIYCSERCSRRAEFQRASARSWTSGPKPCSECGETFTASRRSQVFCTRRCAHRADKKRAAARRRDVA